MSIAVATPQCRPSDPVRVPNITAVPAAPTRDNAQPTLDVFARGTDNQLYHRWWKPGVWTAWQSLRGDLASGVGASVGVGSHNVGILHLGVLGSDGQIHDRSFVNSPGLRRGWSSWGRLGTARFSTAPAVASWGTSHFVMVAKDADNKLRLNSYRFGGGGWTDWQRFPTDPDRVFTSAPAAVAYDVGLLHVFVKGDDNRIYECHTLPAGGWSRWAVLGAETFHSGPAAVSWNTKHLEVFAVGDDRRVWHNWYIFGSRWNGWVLFAGDAVGAIRFTEAPAAATHGDQLLNLFALDDEGRIWERYHEGHGRWTPWQLTGEQRFASGPASASWSNR